MYPTSEYPQLPAAAGYAPVPQPYQQYAVGPAAPMGVPPVAPRGRSAGFWVGITAAVAAAVIVALLAGFFIGRTTRLSNGDVQMRLSQQQQVDQVAQEQAINDLRTDLLRRQRSLVSRVSSTAESRGRREGRAQGRNEGFQEGQGTGFTQGQAQGRNEGFQQGQDQGFDQGVCTVDRFFC